MLSGAIVLGSALMLAAVVPSRFIERVRAAREREQRAMLDNADMLAAIGNSRFMGWRVRSLVSNGMRRTGGDTQVGKYIDRARSDASRPLWCICSPPAGCWRR